MRSAAILAFSLFFLMMLPVVSADHVFSHRVIVTGRVVGSDGTPVAGAPVTVAFEGFTDGGRCFDSKAEETGPRGDFLLCRHAHAMPAGTVGVTVTVQNASRTLPFDKVLRRTAFEIVLDEPAATRDLGGMRLYARTVSVAGRAFIVGDQEVENVPVNGTTRPGIPLTARLIDVNGTTFASSEGVTNEYGDYFIDIDATDVPRNALIEVSSGNERATVALNVFTRRADVDLVHTPTPREPSIGRPGGEIPATGFIAALGCVLVAARLSRRF